MKDDVGHGWFLVRLSVRDGKVVAELTGDHFMGYERDKAYKAVVDGARRSVSDGKSPVYMIRDPVVGIALSAARRAERCGLSKCHEGVGGKPCGICETCLAAERESFTRVILGCVDIPGCEIADRLYDAVASTIGMSCVDAPWADEMTDEEITKVFKEAEEIGLMPEREKDETH